MPGPPTFPSLPSPPPARRRPPTSAPLEARRGAARRLEDLVGRFHTIEGFIDLNGAGEALLDVNFPVWFLEKPLFTFGGELAVDQVLTAGQFPTLSMLVQRWQMKDYPNNVSYFAGATLAIVITGPATQRLIGHWQVQAKALRNPSGETVTVDGPI